MSFSLMIIRAVNIAFEVYFGTLFLRVILSWFRMNPYGKFYQFIFGMTEPLLAPIRRLTMRPGSSFPLDFSPMILMLLIILVQRIVVALLYALLF